MEAGFLVFVILVGVVALAVTLSRQKEATAAWSRAALRLGLPFKPPDLLEKPHIRGRYQGSRVLVDTYRRSHGEVSKTYTRFQVWFPHNLDLGLELTQEGLFSGVSRFFGAQDITVGEPAFDAETMVKGGDPERVTGFLTADRRMGTRRLMKAFPGVTITDERISWSRRGMITDHAIIASTVQKLVRAAREFVEPEGEGSLERAPEARRDARIEDSLEALMSGPRPARVTASLEPLPPPLPEDVIISEPPAAPVDEMLLEGELDHLGDRHEEARQAFEPALTATPEEEEIPQRAEFTVSTPPRAAATQDAAVPDIDLRSFCETLFDAARSTFEASRTFEEQYRAQRIHWTGTLQGVETFDYDFVFGSGPAVKAMIEVHRIPSNVLGESRVVCVLQLPADALPTLEEAQGQRLEFSGTLLKVDALTRRIYLADAALS